LRLPGKQEEFVRQLIATDKPVVLVIFGGRAQVIGDLADKCAAVIQAWYPGEEGGNAVADIIYGNVNPSGKLSVGYPKVELNENICYNHSEKMDSRLQWPFGYGMSYTDYDYSNLKVDKSASTDDELFNISFDVTNSGNRKGDEVVQLYLSPTNKAQPLKPIKLVGFGRVSLKPGETKNVRFIMSPQQLGYYADKKWHIAPGDYQIKVGASSAEIRAIDTISLTGDIVELPLRTVYFSEIVVDK
jgi:beta-glucosidase